MPFDIASTSVKIEAPVVVKPDTVSNNASTNEGISLEIKNGKQPNILRTIQPIPTETKPSFAKNRLFAYLHNTYSNEAIPNIITIETINPITAFKF